MKKEFVLICSLVVQFGCIDTNVTHVDKDRTETELIPKLERVDFKKNRNRKQLVDSK